MRSYAGGTSLEVNGSCLFGIFFSLSCGGGLGRGEKMRGSFRVCLYHNIRRRDGGANDLALNQSRDGTGLGAIFSVCCLVDPDNVFS